MNQYDPSLARDFDIEISGKQDGVNYTLEAEHNEAGFVILKLKLNSPELFEPKPLTLKWKIENINVKGVWKSSIDITKRLQYDWELDHLNSRISVDAPVVSVFGHDDSNVCTFACSDAINMVQMNALLREESNKILCHTTLFSERHPLIKEYEIDIRIDARSIRFSDALKETSQWWEQYEKLEPAHVPNIAKLPLYSTWYQYHQSLDVNVLLEECKMASDLGYKLIILDDGWQTLDTNRGYDYTGDWRPDRIPNMKDVVDQIHKLGMQIGLWYSVPFCGKKSKAYQKFKGKFLTEKHRWAPVFDPRFPEVREYLIDTYTKAISEWGIDGFKLDFIDDFIAYPDTQLTKKDGRDYASVNDGVAQLLTDVMSELRKINPEVFIEFRQQYIGPAVRHFGNMFRAFDCPNDSNTNRVRISDLRLLMGDSAVHADPFTWNLKEPVELAAMQFVNTIFGVPQLSVELKTLPADHLKMVGFYTSYWNKNRDALLGENFIPQKPMSGYPIIKTIRDNLAIIGIYDDTVIELDSEIDNIDLLNGKNSDYIVVKNKSKAREFDVQTYDCMGVLRDTTSWTVEIGIVEIYVPVSGLIKLRKK